MFGASLREPWSAKQFILDILLGVGSKFGHKESSLLQCVEVPRPETITQLKFLIGAYKSAPDFGIQ